jgi:hypothetical protein
MANDENLKPFKKGYDPRRNLDGAPRKYVSQLTDFGYTKSEVIDTIQSMMAMTMDELKTVWDNPKATILEKTVANAMKKSLEKGTLYSLDLLLTRVYGQPKQETQTDVRIINRFDFE